MWLHDGYVVKASGVFQNGIGIISGIHHVIHRSHTLRSHGHQRNGARYVMDVGSAQDHADRYLAVGHIEMKLVATPVMLVSLRRSLYSDGTGSRYFGHHLLQRHLALALDLRTSFSRFCPLFA